MPEPSKTQTQRIELIGFPDKIGEELRKHLSERYGHDCLRFREEKLAPDVLLGDSLVRCIWLEESSPITPPSFQGLAIGVVKRITPPRQAELVRHGYTSVIDLEDCTPPNACELISAYAQQAAKRFDRKSNQPLPSLHEPEVAIPTMVPSIGQSEFLAASVEMLEIGVYVLDNQRGDTVTVWNREMERLFQRKKKAVLGKSIELLFEDPLTRNVFREMPSDYSRNRAIFPSKGPTRSNFIADISKTQLRDPKGKETALVGIIQDVTNRIHSENRLIAAFNELEASKEKLEQSNQEIRRGIEKAKKLAVLAQSSNKAKSYFLSNISHELRTPLNSIVSLTHALGEGTFGALNAKQSEFLEIVADSGRHLQSLINDILDLSKIELGKMSLKFAATNLEDIAKSTIRMINQEATLKEVSCVLEVSDALPEIDADAKRLRQILLNLLVNAVKFSKPKSEVTLRIEPAEDRQSVDFIVIDHGIGIDAQNFSKIFSPFTQLDDKLSRQYEGTGLGLAIASKFVELHGGGLSLKSAVGKGSTFTATLPATQPTITPSPSSLASIAEIAAENQDNDNLLVIVDENEQSALRLQEQARQNSHLQPVVALPNELAAYHDQIAPQVIIVDIGIISTHGTEWMTTSQHHPSWQNTLWVAVSSIDLPDNEQAAKNIGFHACHCKPLTDDLLKRILS